jgi:DtxR family Mn-dependent transcriptional regulator
MPGLYLSSIVDDGFAQGYDARVQDYEHVWRAFEANEITHSAAHYLLAIAAAMKTGRAPRAADIARQLGVSRAAASLQVRTLRENGLLEVDDHHHISLTRGGADLVARIAGKREIVRVFLEEVLGVDSATAEMDACKVEHLISEQTGAALIRLITFLRSGYPAAEECLTVFRETIAACGPLSRCDLCSEVCLLNAMHPS